MKLAHKLFAFAWFVTNIRSGHCLNRTFYISIEETEWDYAPSGQNLMKNILLESDDDATVFATTGTNRIGRKYKKAIYRMYDDEQFTVAQIPPENRGLLSAVIRAEVNDVIIVKARNLASRNYSLHPHGVFYTKQNEGAVYKDGVSSVDNRGDKIPSGGYYTYLWEVTPDYGPTDKDPNCLTWAFHSHVDSPKDTNSGLVGAILVCRPGTLDVQGNRLDVDKEFVLLFTVLDENESWYLEENIRKYTSDPSTVNKADEDFKESNKMHGINGLIYGNLLGVSACEGDRISWHLMAMGTEVDIHSVGFHGQTLLFEGHRQDTVSLFPGVFSTVEMQAVNPGKWVLTCLVNDHVTAGMNTHFVVDGTCGHDKLTFTEDNVKEYFIGIIEADWDYAPSGMNLLTNKQLTANGTDSKVFFERRDDRIGGVYKKAIYQGYESAAFTEKSSKRSDLGILGPIIQGVIGDTIRVTLRNMASRMYNIEPHGVLYNDKTPLSPGEVHTYTWKIPENLGPTELDEDCITYLYTSRVDSVKDTNSGLFGPLLVCKSGTPERNTDTFFLLLTVMDENLSHYLDDNIARFVFDSSSVDKTNEDFKESNLMHAINGRMYGNLLGITLCTQKKAIFHVIGLGTEVDIHSVTMTGLNIKVRNEFTGVASVFPHTTATFTVTPPETGTGQLQCQVVDHLQGGMVTTFNVIPCWIPNLQRSNWNTKIYYIGAVEEVWDYVPSGEDVFGNSIESPESTLNAFTRQEDGKFIGRKYLKAIYYEYSDDSFTQRVKKADNLGLLGPLISAEEGDEIEIIFKNMASRDYSMFPWGINSDYLASGTESARPGETVTYHWKVPSSAVPRENQPGCHSYLYLSNVDQIKDVYSGLVGPLLVCRKGAMFQQNQLYRDADREFFLLFWIIDENKSHYLDANIARFMKVDPNTIDKEDEDIVESNLMHGINGRLAHLDGLTTMKGDRVIWHLFGLGNEVDLHTVHFHAHAFNHTSDKVTHADVFNLFPGRIATLEMNVNAVGEWLLHCHVNDHISGGMETTYSVLPKSSESGSSLCYGIRGKRNSIKLYCKFDAQTDLDGLTIVDGLTMVAPVITIAGERRIEEIGRFLVTNVYSLNVKTSKNYNLDSEIFANLLSFFPEIRIINARHCGLNSLQSGTFQYNSRLEEIDLSHNYLQELPDRLLTGSWHVRKSINLKFNDLRFVQWETMYNGYGQNKLSPLGVTGCIDTRRNPKLGEDQFYRCFS